MENALITATVMMVSVVIFMIAVTVLNRKK